MSNRPSAVSLAFTPVLVVAVVGACGGGSSSSPTPHGVVDASTDDVAAVDAGSVTAEAGPAPTSTSCVGQALPDDAHFVAPGLCARVVAPAIPGLRQIMFAPNGDLFGQNLGGKIYLLRDADGDGVFSDSEVHLWADTGANGNNAHVDATSGFVYAGSAAGVKRFPYTPTALTGGDGEDVVVGQPGDGSHAKHTVHVYDGYLYVHSGSSGNATHSGGDGQTAYDTNRALIKRFPLSAFIPGAPFDWSAGEPFTVGMRNANGFTRDETTKKLYAVVNWLDELTYDGADVHLDNPGETIVELGLGKQYGYPFCFTAQRIVNADHSVVPPGTQLINAEYTRNPYDDGWCATNSSKPVTFLAAHSAPLDMAFFDVQKAGALPERWRTGAFVALHGSWDRAPATGYKVVWVPSKDGAPPMPTSTADATTFPYETVFGGGSAAGGAADGPWTWASATIGESPRPAGVAVSPVDGALYVASDSGGFLYRIRTAD